MSRVIKYAVGTVAVAGLVLACSHNASTVSGLQDDTRHVPLIAHTGYHSVPVTQQRCTTTSRTVTTTVNGKTVTKTVPSTTCKSVRVGTRQEPYQVVTQYERFCVELDNVNGHKSDDDRWFTVSSATYYAARNRDEGDRVTKMPFLHRGC